MSIFEKIKNRIISHCDERKYDYRLGKVSIDYLVKDLIKDFEGNNGWIPCSERLPSKEEFLKDDGRFIVTDGNRRYESIYDIYTHCFRTLKLFDFNSDGRNSRFEYDGCVIAWQPLPEEYKEGGVQDAKC